MEGPVHCTQQNIETIFNDGCACDWRVKGCEGEGMGVHVGCRDGCACDGRVKGWVCMLWDGCACDGWAEGWVCM